MKDGFNVRREQWQRAHIGIHVFIGHEPCIVTLYQGTLRPGWVPSQSDMLADDWCIA